MKSKTLFEYDNEIRMYDTMLDIFKKCVEEYSEEIWGELDYEFLRYVQGELKKERDNLEFYKATQEAFDRCDDSKKGMSVEEFLKELERWCYDWWEIIIKVH